mmetsp:Transcript_2513/g.8429  ORF Transcript_2513/g.8429 Transcript_2513/m.8429 type:complete len:493 (-) Transcript_2513:125-1603(-)
MIKKARGKDSRMGFPALSSILWLWMSGSFLLASGLLQAQPATLKGGAVVVPSSSRSSSQQVFFKKPTTTLPPNGGGGAAAEEKKKQPKTKKKKKDEWVPSVSAKEEEDRWYSWIDEIPGEYNTYEKLAHQENGWTWGEARDYRYAKPGLRADRINDMLEPSRERQVHTNEEAALKFGAVFQLDALLENDLEMAQMNAWMETARTVGKRLTEKDLAPLLSRNAPEFEMVVDDFAWTKDVSEARRIVQRYNRILDDKLSRVVFALTKGAKDYLVMLRQNAIKAGLTSRLPRKHVHKILDNLGIAGYFKNRVITKEDNRQGADQEVLCACLAMERQPKWTIVYAANPDEMKDFRRDFQSFISVTDKHDPSYERSVANRVYQTVPDFDNVMAIDNLMDTIHEPADPFDQEVNPQANKITPRRYPKVAIGLLDPDAEDDDDDDDADQKKGGKGRGPWNFFFKKKKDTSPPGGKKKRKKLKPYIVPGVPPPPVPGGYA